MTQHKDCTAKEPFRPEKDTVWTHMDVEELEDLDTFGVLYKCNFCGVKFIADNTR